MIRHFTFLTDTAFCFSSHVPAPLRVILSEAAPPAKNQAYPPIIAAQSNPAPSGAPAGGISVVKRYHLTHRTHPVGNDPCVVPQIPNKVFTPHGVKIKIYSEKEKRKMKRTNKKGFTIVELVIVIAVIAILAAVLIPNISRLVRKANESNDASLAKNMNTLLTMDEAENGKATNMYDVLIALENGGFKLSTLNPRASGNVFAWDKANNQIVYLSKDKILFQAKEVKNKGDLYITTRDADTFKNFPGYSFYLVQDLTADVKLEKGSNLDTGEFTLTGTVSCTTDKDVDIRGKINGTLTVNSTAGKITNYSIVENVVIKNTASTSYHERGQVKTFTIDNTLTGKVVFENDAYIETLTQNNATTGTVVNRGYIKNEVVGSATDKVENPDDYTLEISTFEELCNFRDKVNAGATYEGMTVKLTVDIDISSRAWTPIGAYPRKVDGKTLNEVSAATVFKGKFDGQGYTISGLTNTGFRISTSYMGNNATTPTNYNEYVFGLFGSIVDAEIRNLNLTKVNIDLVCDNTLKVLGDSVGAVVGNVAGTGCKIENCKVLSGKISGYDATAGVIGRITATETTVSGCVNAVAVESTRRAAGIIGYTDQIANLKIQNCENKATVTCMSNDDELGIPAQNAGYYQAAGIANANPADNIIGTNIDKNTNSGSVTNKSTLDKAGAGQYFTFANGKVSNNGTAIVDPKIS